MRPSLPQTLGISLILVAAACGGSPEPPTPAMNQDSLDALAARRADSIAEAQRIADSIARAREAALALERAREDSLNALRRETERVRAMLETAVHFDYDRSNIRAEDASILDQKLLIMQANPGLRIQVTGHADERGSDEYNLALGNRRALSAKRYLVDRGIAESRVTTNSMGEERPIDTGSNEAAWARNRRAEAAITSGGSQLRMPQM